MGSQRPSLTPQQEHILRVMNDVSDRVILLVGACGTSSSIDSHKTNSFLKSAFEVSEKVPETLPESWRLLEKERLPNRAASPIYVIDVVCCLMGPCPCNVSGVTF